jgi:hypothetical protein
VGEAVVVVLASQPLLFPPPNNSLRLHHHPPFFHSLWFTHALPTLHTPHPHNHRRPFFSFVYLALVNHGTFWVVVEGGGREGREGRRREKKRGRRDVCLMASLGCACRCGHYAACLCGQSRSIQTGAGASPGLWWQIGREAATRGHERRNGWLGRMHGCDCALSSQPHGVGAHGVCQMLCLG